VQEAVPAPLAGTTAVTGAAVGPPQSVVEPWVKVTFPVGGTPEAVAPLGVIVAVKVTD
jgi:hypothetical protein